MSTTKTRIRLTQAQKLAFCEHHAAYPEQSQRVVCAWAQERFKLPRRLAILTLWDVLRNRNGDATLNASRKTNQRAWFPHLEAELLRWIVQCERLKLPFVNGATICAKARKIRAELMQSASPSAAEGLKALKFSSSWLFKFQKRNCLSSKRTHGEASSVSDATVSMGRVLLKEAISGYERHNILNMDEIAYFYCAVPTSAITRDRISGRKQIKKRLTVAVACSADSSLKLPLFFVGTARQPRCFESKSAEDLDLEYGNSPKGWMNTELFQGWVSRLDARMRSESRSVLLLLDNVSSHRAPEMLTHVEIRMLPPNTTAHLQPFDAGIIRNFKSTISKKKALYYADRLDEILSRVGEVGQETAERDLETISNVDVLVAMRWAQEAWASVTCTTISNCWRHTGVLDEELYELIEGVAKLRV